ncbi:CaiB/BaiF CoA transferase family protein [Nocardia australiensis]|uniref:CaiB/BaiF CoA transferase family protein n=1 Tax=Nocardia australiensis TaxID=2887191 RepID=UPI001D14A8F7|nr:CaiB/BaiF CoA-transferase family protein [Nocardia australiensis]
MSTDERTVDAAKTQSPGPLAGIRIVEFAGIGPVPYACLILAELGADVIRVDRVGGTGRAIAPSFGLERSRPNVIVDLKSQRGREVALRLADEADVLIEGFRPGVTERLGIGPDICRGRNPRLIYARTTGWGQSGPLRDRAGHDINYASLTGALHTVGTRDKPMQAVNMIADFAGGSLFLVIGVLAALQERAQSGVGQVVDAAMVDGASSLVTMIYGMFATGLWTDDRQSNLLDGDAPFYDTYRCADGAFVAVGALEPQFYSQLLDGLGLAGKLVGNQHDRAQWPEHRKAFTRAFAARTRDEWEEHFADSDACVTPVLSLAEAPRHPHNVARGIFAMVDGAPQPRVAPRFSRTPVLEPRSASLPGADTATALQAWGFTGEEVAALHESGDIHQSVRGTSEGDPATARS